MHEPFILTVNYSGQELEFPAAFQRFGYTYRIVVTIAEVNYTFEPDEEGSYRVIGGVNATKMPATGLLQAIAQKLQKLNG